MKLNALLVEDEPAAQKHFLSLVQNHLPKVHLASTCSTVREARQWLTEHTVDVVFLDVNLSDASGFDLLDAVPERTFHVVFVTGYDQYVLRALRSHAIDYLLKPVDAAGLQTAVERILQQQKQPAFEPAYRQALHRSRDEYEQRVEPTSITLYHSKGFDLVPFTDILYLRGEDNYTRFVLQDGSTKLVSRTLREFEDLLTPVGFLRIHKSVIVHPRWIRCYRFDSTGEVELHNGDRLEVSRRRSGQLFQALDRHSIGTKSTTRFRA